MTAPSTASSMEEPHVTQSAVFQPFNQYGAVYNLYGSAESHPIHLPALHGGEGLLFQVLFH